MKKHSRKEIEEILKKYPEILQQEISNVRPIVHKTAKSYDQNSTDKKNRISYKIKRCSV